MFNYFQVRVALNHVSHFPPETIPGVCGQDNEKMERLQGKKNSDVAMSVWQALTGTNL